MTRALLITAARPPRGFRAVAAASPASRSDHAIITPALLDRLADFELALGHGKAAEHLARRAAAMREAAR